MELFNILDVLEITNEKLADDGLPLGTRVLVVSAKAFPISEEDPYTQRIKLLVQKLNDNNDGVEGNVFVVDPTSVKQTGLKAIQGDEEPGVVH